MSLEFKKPKLFLMVGIPSSGKSTYAQRHFPFAYIVSTDAIRKELTGSEGNFSKDGLVFNIAHNRVLGALLSNQDVVFDACNVKKQYRTDLLNLLARNLVRYDPIAVVMHVDPAQAMRMQQGRERQVPAEVICRFYNSMAPPSWEEGYVEIRQVKAI